MGYYQEQEKFIWRIYIRGDKEELATLDRMIEDPEVDPEVVKIILSVREKFNLYSGRSESGIYPPAYGL